MKKLIFLVSATLLIVGIHCVTSRDTSFNEVENHQRNEVLKVMEEESQEQLQGELMYIISDSYLRVEPEEEAEHLADLNIGAEVLVLGEVGEFKQVKFFDIMGYIYSENIGDAEQLKEKEESIKYYHIGMAQHRANIAYENRSDEEKEKEYQEALLRMQQEQEEKAKAEEEYKNSLSPLDLLVENIKLEGTEDSTLKRKIKKYFSKIPENLLDRFNQSGWRITITTKNIADTYYEGEDIGSICGLTITEKKHIVYEANASKFRRNVLHEFFHYVDYTNGWLSIKEEWQEIYQVEKNKLKVTDGSSYTFYKKNAQEYFAEAFQEYFYNPNGVASKCPKTYQYIKNLLETFK